MKENKFERIILTPEQEAWLVKHFKHTKNADVAQKLGVSLRSVNRLAERRGLKKSKQFITKCQENATAKAHESNLRNGTYPPKGYLIPNSEKGQFKKGERPIDRLGEKKEEERVAKAAETGEGEGIVRTAEADETEGGEEADRADSAAVLSKEEGIHRGEGQQYSILYC